MDRQLHRIKFLTQAEYDALPVSKQMDGTMYFIENDNALDTLKEISDYVQNHGRVLRNGPEYGEGIKDNLPSNCINCGAPIELHRDSCPYCRTLYKNMKRR